MPGRARTQRIGVVDLPAAHVKGLTARVQQFDELILVLHVQTVSVGIAEQTRIRGVVEHLIQHNRGTGLVVVVDGERSHAVRVGQRIDGVAHAHLHKFTAFDLAVVDRGHGDSSTEASGRNHDRRRRNAVVVGRGRPAKVQLNLHFACRGRIECDHEVEGSAVFRHHRGGRLDLGLRNQVHIVGRTGPNSEQG